MYSRNAIPFDKIRITLSIMQINILTFTQVIRLDLYKQMQGMNYNENVKIMSSLTQNFHMATTFKTVVLNW